MQIERSSGFFTARKYLMSASEDGVEQLLNKVKTQMKNLILTSHARVFRLTEPVEPDEPVSCICVCDVYVWLSNDDNDNICMILVVVAKTNKFPNNLYFMYRYLNSFFGFCVYLNC